MTIFEYELRVPALADGPDGWEKPAKADTVTDWSGTAHDLGRDVLRTWEDECPERYQGYPAVVEVHSEEGAFATVKDSTRASEHVRALEAALEKKQALDHQADRAEDELAEAMRDANRFGGLSKNNVAERVKAVMSRPTALDLMKD